MGSQKFLVPSLAWYGQKELRLDFPEDWKISFLPMKGYSMRPLTDAEIKMALEHPIGTRRLAKLAQGKREVAIVVDDMTRATKAYQIIPHLLDELKTAGIPDEHIRFIIAAGLHAAWYRDDFAKKIGEEFVERYPVYNHNPFGNYEKVGITTRGIAVEVNAEYLSCDLRIGIGSVVPHGDAGFGGGAKIILPGISSYYSAYHMHLSSQEHHAEMEGAGPHWGSLKGNRIREDIDEAGKIAGMNMKIDVLLNGFGDTAKVFAGDLQQEFTSAIACARQHYFTPDMPDSFDVLIANTYAKANEASLALSNWKHRMKKESVMVIIAQAPEGQVTHYLFGKFGKRQSAPCYASEKTGFKKLIIFSEYKTPDPLLPIAESEEIWLKNWDDVVNELKSMFDHAPTVALLPNSEIQCDEQTMMQQ